MIINIININFNIIDTTITYINVPFMPKTLTQNTLLNHLRKLFDIYTCQ